MKKIISIFLTICIVLSLCSCTIGVPNTQLTMGILDEITTLDPIYAKGDGEKIIATNCFEGLLRFDEDGNIDLAGATSYTSDKNSLSYTFKLNPKAQWYVSDIVKSTLETFGITEFDGKITAEDYIFGIKTFIESGRTELNAIEGAEDFQKGKPGTELGVKAQDDYTLQIELEKNDADFLYKLATLPVFPCDETFYDIFEGIYCTTPSTTICNGPYFVKDVVPTETTIEKNPEYNGNIQVLNKSITLYNTGKESALVTRLEEGAYDIAVISSKEKLKNNKPVSTLVSDIWGLSFNCSDEVFSNINLRKILLNTIELSEIKLPDFALKKAKRIIPETFIINYNIYGSSEKEDLVFTSDKDGALESLESYLYENGLEYLSVTFAVPEAMTETADEMLSRWNNIFGEKISVELLIFENDEIEEVMTEKLYDIAILPLSPEYTTCFSLINTFSGSPCFYKSNKMGSYKTDIKNAPAYSDEVYESVEKLIANNAVFVPLFSTGCRLYTSKDVKGIYMADAGNKIYLHAGELVEE